MNAKKSKRPSLQYPTTPVFDLLRKTSGRIPEKVAIIDPPGSRQLTFAQINQESDILAEIFLRWGIKKGDRISFLSPMDGNISWRSTPP
jgi:non-ribosomal peptide synthetase component E (peptide arylation enzyme)